MKTTKLTILLVLLISTTSCFFDGFGIQGNRNVVSEDRKISSDFEGLKVSQGITVYLSQGNSVDLSVEADENIIDLLVTEVKGDVLHIYFDKNVSRAKAKNVYLTMNKIEKIKTSSGAHVRSEHDLSAKSLELSCSSGSSMKIEVDAQEISGSTSSGADMRISGSSNSFKGDASSGSQIHARDLKTNKSNVDVSSGAGIYIYAQEELTAHASSGGYVNYDGEPKILNQSKSSGGSISKH